MKFHLDLVMKAVDLDLTRHHALQKQEVVREVGQILRSLGLSAMALSTIAPYKSISSVHSIEIIEQSLNNPSKKVILK